MNSTASSARAAAATTTATATATATAASLPFATDTTSASPDDARRLSLLRRLNEITQQRHRLERRVQQVSLSDTAIAVAVTNGHSRTAATAAAERRSRASDAPTPPSTRRNAADALKPPPQSESAAAATRRKHGVQKRRRGDSPAGVADPPPPAAADEPPDHAPRNGKLRHSRTRSNGRQQHAAAPPPDLGSPVGATTSTAAAAPSPAPTRVDHPRSSKKDRASQPPNPPPASGSASPPGRGGRVRTPSVLLSSRPGEKNAAGKNNAALKDKQVIYCLRIVKDMLRQKDGFGFSKPIDTLWSVDQLPGYFELITQPMDLDTVRKKLESGFYMKAPGKEEVEEVAFDKEAFSADMRLIFSNARTYNRVGDVFYVAATKLSEKFETRIAQMPTPEQLAQRVASRSKKRKKGMSADALRKEGSSKKRKVPSSAPDGERASQVKKSASKKKSAKGPSKAQPPSSSTSKKKPVSESQDQPDTARMSVADMESRLRALKRQKVLLSKAASPASPTGGGASYMDQAKALYHIEMTYEEKVQLSNNVSNLPADKLQKLVTLASKNRDTSMEVNNNEEIELDIDSMDNETLRQMEAYVNMALTKGKKKGSPSSVPNADVQQMSSAQVAEEIERLSGLLRKRTKGRSKELDNDSGGGNGDKSFYESDSSSSDDSGSESSDSSSGSESSDEESDEETMQKRRERNLAHQRAMRAAGTPLASPPYQDGRRSS